MSTSSADKSSVRFANRRNSSSSNTSTSTNLGKAEAARPSVPRSHSTPDSDLRASATIHAKPRSRRKSNSQCTQPPSAQDSTALYYRSCELFPRPVSARLKSSSNQHQGTMSRTEQWTTTQIPVRVDRMRHDSAVSCFDDDPYRNSTDEPRPVLSPTSPTSIRRPPTDWNFARQQNMIEPAPTSTDSAHMQSLLRFNSSSSPELSNHMLVEKHPQTITYWTAPRNLNDTEFDSAQIWRPGPHGLRKAFRLLSPNWLFRMRRKSNGLRESELHYWDGEDDKCTVRRFKVR